MTTCSKSRTVKDSIHLVTELRKTVASVRVIARSTETQSGHWNLLARTLHNSPEIVIYVPNFGFGTHRVFADLLLFWQARIETIEIAAHPGLSAVLTLSRYIHRSTLRSCGRLRCRIATFFDAAQNVRFWH